MRLLRILGDSKFGGGSIIVGQLATRARQEGWSVDVLTTDPVSQAWFREAGMGVVAVDAIWRQIRPYKDLKGMYRLYDFLRRDHYDIVHTHTSKAGFVGRLAATMARVPAVIHTVHGFAFHEASSRNAMLAYSTLERLAAHCCHRLVTVSEHHRTWALKLGIGTPEKVVAIPNGISDVVRADAASAEAVRRSLGCENGDIVLLSTGRLAPQKGLEFLLRALPALRAKFGPRLKVFLAGDGPLAGDLRALAQQLGVDSSVIFLGFRSDVRELLSAADLVVLPSLWEGLSISLLEAMAAGRPVVTTTIGSNVEVTRNGDCAALVPPGDPEALAAAISMLLGDPMCRQQLAARARKIFADHYTESAMLDAYMDVYRSLSAAPDALRARHVVA